MIAHKLNEDGRVELPVTAQDAAIAIKEKLSMEIGASNAWSAIEEAKRRIDPYPKDVYIFNVSPMAYSDYINPTGKFFIPACLRAERYAGPLVIPGMIFEPIKTGAFDELGRPLYTVLMETGTHIAETILGIAPLQGRASGLEGASLATRGCFLSPVCPPREEDVKQARAALRAWVNGFLGDPAPQPQRPTFVERIKQMFSRANRPN